jgi:glycine/D-amino acid oxidase-like deaminating enzyme
MDSTADGVIIGGGVMGCSILYNLAARGMTGAILLERDILGSGSTGRSSGAVRMHYSTEVHARMARQSLDIFQNFGEIVGGPGSDGVGFVKTGYLVFAGGGDLESFRSKVAMQQRAGIDTRIISREEAREIAPGFYLDDCAGIAYEPSSGHADASGTAAAYSSRARELGARVLLKTPATGIETASGKVVAVKTGDQRIETPLAVVATGPWSRRFLLDQGIDLPLEATRHEVIHLNRPLDLLPHHPGGGDIANLIYFRPEGAGLTLVGNGNMEDVVEDPEIFAPRPSQGYIYDVWSRLTRRIPAMAQATYNTGYAGLYTSTPDSHPIMDRVEGIEGLYICTGFSGHGFKLSPMTGVLMAELILDGQAATIDISPLRMSRFKDGQLNQSGYGFKVLV